MPDRNGLLRVSMPECAPVLLQQRQKIIPRIDAVPELPFVVHLGAVAMTQTPEGITSLLQPPCHQHQLSGPQGLRSPLTGPTGEACVHASNAETNLARKR